MNKRIGRSNYLFTFDSGLVVDLREISYVTQVGDEDRWYLGMKTGKVFMCCPQEEAPSRGSGVWADSPSWAQRDKLVGAWHSTQSEVSR